MPNMDVLIAKVANARYLSTVDYLRGYNQIRVEVNSLKYTSFVTEFGQFFYLKMPFGLTSAASTCQYLSDLICEDHRDYAQAYLDDIIIFSPTLKSHLVHLSKVLTSISSAGITLKPKKCTLGVLLL